MSSGLCLRVFGEMLVLVEARADLFNLRPRRNEPTPADNRLRLRLLRSVTAAQAFVDLRGKPHLRARPRRRRSARWITFVRNRNPPGLAIAGPAAAAWQAVFPAADDLSDRDAVRTFAARILEMVLGEPLPAATAPVGVAPAGAAPADAGEAGIIPKTTRG